ncbi:FKBP-type peptidyl-prolyl cis-trans isomerase [Bowdeniella massiliensis]|uniref:FKBP-type peptidyl-prolyl cis-trans isomerase n=1 Tax=Bowdeniella massiliensis TaxID=2932264 RepID=UPI0020289B6F|nr:FKBP-type peptidyl-prolyl cis-trans isomerase [Bowdeniella massiliensis]
MKRFALAATAAAALVLSACSGNSTATDPETSAPSTTAPQSDVAVKVVDSPIFEVKGDAGSAPELTFNGDAPAELQRYTLDAKPDGAEVGPDDVVYAHYHGQVWNGEKFDSSYDRGAPIAFSLNGVIPGWKHGLTGARVGERVELSIPSEYGYPNGTPDGGIKAGDTIVFVVEILDSVAPDTPAPAAGEQVSDPAELGLTVEDADGQLKSVTVEKGTTEPTEPKLVKLTEGTGEGTVAENSQMIVRVVGGTFNGEPTPGGAQIITADAAALPDTVGAAPGARFALLSPASGQGPAQAAVFDIIKVLSAK